MTTTETNLIEVLSKGLTIPSTRTITPDTAIFGKGGGNGLGLDSVDILEIAVLLDKHFGVVLEEQNEEVHKALTNISTLAAYVDAHKPP